MTRVASTSALPPHANAAVIEAAYESWLQNADSVDPTWRAFFQGFTLGSNGASPAAALASGDTPAAAQAQAGRPAQVAQTQALLRAASGMRASRSALKLASTHQHGG